MTKKLLSALLLLIGVVQAVSAQEPYAVLSSDNKTLTFYYDDQKAARGGMDVGPFTFSYLGVNSGWYYQRGSITSAVFDSSFADCTTITSTAYWFRECSNLTSITGMENLNTANVTDMSGMFYGCSGLTTLDVTHFNTANVKDMHYMFDRCSGLTSLDVSNFNTANVTNMGGMFWYCSGLTTLDVSNFNTANVMYMRYMFYGCSGLTTIYCNDTWSCGKSEYMFTDCASLVGAIAYDLAKDDVTYANPDTGYFTRTGGTSISTLNAGNGQLNDGPVYTLSGQRLSQPQKGVNIIGGKKVVVK